MLTLPGVIILLVLVMMRPMEVWPELAPYRLVPIGMALAVIGFGADVLLGKAATKATPVTWPALAFFFWCLVCLGRVGHPDLLDGVLRIMTSVIICLVVAHGTLEPTGLGTMGRAVLMLSLALASVGVHQRMQPKQCILMVDDTEEQEQADGRSCDDRFTCYRPPGRIEGRRYGCEHVGLFGTSTMGGGRVRYLGFLADPNELALALSAALPLVFATRKQRSGIAQWAMTAFAVVLITLCVIFTRSRGGQLALITVMGCYVVARTGLRGVVIGAILAIPVLVFGGRSGESADSSSYGRIEAWYEGIDMFKESPLFGVGPGMFVDHHHLTAHNAYVLALSETGAPGYLLFCGILYAAIKIPWTAMKRYKDKKDPRRVWALSLLASLSGIAVGITFLSWTYHYALWLMVGLSGAFYSVLRKVDAGFSVTLRARDYLGIVVGAVSILFLLFVYTRLNA